MAYPHYQITVPFLTSGGDTALNASTATGDKGRIAPGAATYYVRRVAMQPTTTAIWATGCKLSFRTTTGQNTSATGGEFATINFASGKAVGKGGMYFNDSFTPKKVQAGYFITVANKTKSTGKFFRAWALLEPSTERLQNFSTGKYVSVTG